jgi:hypothetical protein
MICLLLSHADAPVLDILNSLHNGLRYATRIFTPTTAPVVYAHYGNLFIVSESSRGRAMVQETHMCLVNINADVVSSTNHHQIKAY